MILLDKAINKDKNDALAYNNKGTILMTLKRF